MKIFLQTLFFFLLVTQICFAQWYLQTSRTTQHLNAVTFTNVNNGYAVGDSGTILLTTNVGTDWTPILSGTTNDFNDICFTDANNGWAIAGDKYFDTTTDSSIILHTTDGGATWRNQLLVPLSNLSDLFFIDVNTGFAVGRVQDNLNRYSIILRTTNGGLNWNQIIVDTSLYSAIKVYFADANNGWVIERRTYYMYASRILRTTDGGINWYQQLETDPGVLLWSISFADFNNGIAVGGSYTNTGTYGVIIKTTDGGETWSLQSDIEHPFGDFEFRDVFFVSDNTFAVLGQCVYFNSELFLSWTTDGGTNWICRHSGIDYNFNNRLYFTDANTCWIVGDNGTIFHTTNGGVTFIEEGQIEETPTEFLLSQNYPNPFNSSSVIKYSIPKSSQVTLKIFNTLGEEIETLVNDEKTVGTYEVNWNAANLPSGVYFYRLQAGSFVQTRKMILLK